jgi:hypothetical protein
MLVFSFDTGGLCPVTRKLRRIRVKMKAGASGSRAVALHSADAPTDGRGRPLDASAFERRRLADGTGRRNFRMSKQAYTLAMYRVKEGQVEAFISAWNELAGAFSALPEPPLWGTLIRHREDRTLFYSFGPWRSPEHVRAMRGSAAAGAAFGRLRELCVELTPGDFELVTHVDVEAERPA